MIYIAIARGVRGITSDVRRRGFATGRAAAERSASTRRRTAARPGRSSGTRRPPDSLRGVTRLEIDPLDHTTVYASRVPARHLPLARRRPVPAGLRGAGADGATPTARVRADASRTARRASTRRMAPKARPTLPYAALFRTDDASLLVDRAAPNAALWKKLTSNVNGDPVLRDVRLLHRPVLVRPGRRDAAGRARHGVRDRLVHLRRARGSLERARRACARRRRASRTRRRTTGRSPT